MKNDFYELLQEAFSKKIISYPLGKEEAYNQGVLACKSILHDIQKRGFRNKDVVQVIRCKDCKYAQNGVFSKSLSCMVWWDKFSPEDFCSTGKRRDEDETHWFG